MDDPADSGFDAAVEFHPDHEVLQTIRPLYTGAAWRALRRLGLASRAVGTNWVYRYADWAAAAARRPEPPYKRFPCVVPSWDNSARCKIRAAIFVGSTPELYERWLEAGIRRSLALGRGEQVVFVNAWNEWAEGNHLEPDRRYGRAYLEATRRALEYFRQGQESAFPPRATAPRECAAEPR